MPSIEVTAPGSPSTNPQARWRSLVVSGTAPEPQDCVPPDPLLLSVANDESSVQMRVAFVSHPLLSPAPIVSAAWETQAM